MKNWEKAGIVAIVFLVLLVTALAGGMQSLQGHVVQPDAPGPIKIGALLPLSGTAASQGRGTQDALGLAAEKINKGKVKIRLEFQDEQCNPKVAMSAYQALRAQGIGIMIGAFCSSSTLAVAPLAEKEKVVLLTPASSADSISQAGDYIFRDHVTARKKGERMARYALEKYETTATLYDNSNEGFVVADKSFAGAFQKGQLHRVVDEEAFERGQTDFRTELAKIKEKRPQALYVGALMPQIALIARQMKELDFNTQILSDDSGVTDSTFIQQAGTLAEGIIFAGSAFSQQTSPEFWNEYEQSFGKPPNIYAAQAYDSLMILAGVIEAKCRNGDSTCVKNALYQVQDYPGAAGATSFDSNGDSIKALQIKIVRNGKFEVMEN